MVVSPFEIFVLTDSPEVIHQVSQQREKFPKIHEAYEILRQYGENVVSANGDTWRRHRKVTAPAFTERNVGRVFSEAVRQAQSMTEALTKRDDGAPSFDTITTLHQKTWTFALHVIGYVGFDLRMLWPGQSLPRGVDTRLAKFSGHEIPKGYSMSFAEALDGNIGTIFWQMIAPRWLLRALPLEGTRYSAEARNNYDRYIEELIQIKAEDARDGAKDLGMDFVGHLVKTKYAAGAQEKNDRVPQLTYSEIEGNTFVLILAGHDTTANAVHFSLAHLAATPSAQRLVQRDIDAILGRDSDPGAWEYADIIQPLGASMVGASMHETLRVVPAFGELPRYVNPERDGIVNIKGEAVTLPPGAHLLIVLVSAHRNPNGWPTKPSRVTGKADDLDDFLPERWYRASDRSAGKSERQEGIEEDNDSSRFADTSDSMFKPQPGSYLPFGDGPRSCIGRRIAQAEILAAMAVVFQRHSIELAVDEWASDAKVSQMSQDERRALYKKAQGRFREKMRKVSSLLTLKLPPGEHIPVRLVPRGQERFVGFVDDEL